MLVVRLYDSLVWHDLRLTFALPARGAKLVQ